MAWPRGPVSCIGSYGRFLPRSTEEHSQVRAQSYLVILVALTVLDGCGSPQFQGSTGADLRQALKEYELAQNELMEDMLKTHTADYVAQNFVHEAPLEKLAQFGPRFLRIAEQNPGSDTAWAALRQVAYIRGFDTTDKTEAMELLVKNHSSRKEFIEDLYFQKVDRRTRELHSSGNRHASVRIQLAACNALAWLN